MKSERLEKSGYTCMDDILPGRVFEWKGNLYIKTRGGDGCNLEDGYYEVFFDSEPVTPINGKFVETDENEQEA